MANCKQAANLSGTIYQEAKIGAKNANQRMCVKISIPEDGGQNEETTWHNCYYFTSSDAEVEYLQKMLVPRAVVNLQGQFKFRKKRHEQYPVDIVVAAFYVDSLTVLYSPAMQERSSKSDVETDPFMDDDPGVSQGVHAPSAPVTPQYSAPRSVPPQNGAHAPRSQPAPAPAAPVVARVAQPAPAYSGPGPVLNF